MIKTMKKHWCNKMDMFEGRIYKVDFIGHLLTFIHDKLKIKISYSIAGIYFFFKKFGSFVLYVGYSSHEVSKNLGFKHMIEWSRFRA